MFELLLDIFSVKAADLQSTEKFQAEIQARLEFRGNQIVIDRIFHKECSCQEKYEASDPCKKIYTHESFPING